MGGAITVSAAVASGLHAQTIPDPVIIPIDYMGDGPGLGSENIGLRQLPPTKPNAILEQGIGRAPGYSDWERKDHAVHDNADWYLGIGAVFQPADYQGGAGPTLQTPIPVSTLVTFNYIQNHEAQSVPGSFSQRTVPAPLALANTATAVLP
jgi:hypothetical protein